ncbi:MAG: hypothetical protein JF603_10705 [Acidobacteria bacterium]|nr:hypothetical protein [Acidobacteriota bacterium]
MSRVFLWLRRRPIESWITLALVVGSVVFIWLQLQPHLLLLDTTPAGGDMGAHVWAPAYLREELLPRWRLAGWAPDWYAGFPAYQFYMVLPGLLIVFLDVVAFLPYNVAFKLVSVSGLLALPVAAWGMGRLARLPFPVPAVLAVATVPYVFDRSWSIYGGNAASTLAGEFAFSISLCFALLFIGVVKRGLDTGRHRAAAAVLLGLTALCHLIPAIFALLAAGVIFILSVDLGEAWKDRRARVQLPASAALALFSLGFVATRKLVLLPVVAACAVVLYRTTRQADDDGDGGVSPLLADARLRAWWVAGAVGVGAMITGFWTFPFYMRRSYMTDMGWEKLTTYWEALFPGRIGDALTSLAGNKGAAGITGDLSWVIVLALVGVGTAVAFRRRFGLIVFVLAAVLAVGVVVAPQGRLWNARLLPFWYLCLYFLAALAVVEIITAIGVLITRVPDRPHRRVTLIGPVVASALAFVAVALPLHALPFGHENADGSYSWLGVSTSDHSFVPDWAKWNYSGYERKPAYPEYQEVVSAMRTVGQERGCGRAMWEYDKDLDRFGTPMALMLLPYWTNGCIGSMEGLYFEASATTPYHFLNQSELSAAPSRAERDLPYGDLDVELGVDHLQLLGVKYYMAFSDSAVAQADAEPDLALVATSGKWRVYEVAHSELVQPLSDEPAVVSGAGKGGKSWQKLAVDWYLDRSRWGVMLAADGPSPWQRVRPGDTPSQRTYSPTTISDLVTGPESISFTVSRPGAPVLIKTSYFPNWKVKGAEGPFRVAPNLMVVVPLDNFVKLTYSRTPVDWFGMALTAGGIYLAFVLSRRRRLRLPPRIARPRSVRRPRPPAGDSSSAEPVYATVGGGSGDDRERWGSPS